MVNELCLETSINDQPNLNFEVITPSNYKLVGLVESSHIHSHLSEHSLVTPELGKVVLDLFVFILKNVCVGVYSKSLALQEPWIWEAVSQAQYLEASSSVFDQGLLTAVQTYSLLNL